MPKATTKCPKYAIYLKDKGESGIYLLWKMKRISGFLNGNKILEMLNIKPYFMAIKHSLCPVVGRFVSLRKKHLCSIFPSIRRYLSLNK
jgi:hypothetical protein